MLNRYFRGAHGRCSLLVTDGGASVQHLEPTGVGQAASAAVSRRDGPPRIAGILAGHDDDRDSLAIMAARFPVVRRLVGGDSFDLMARRFVQRQSPGSLSRHHHDGAFARFIRGQGAAASFEYVADIVELEDACKRARDCAEVRPLGARAFASLPVERLNGVRVELHRSFGLVASRFPIVTVWQNNRHGDRGSMIERWRAEDALVVRSFRKVEVWRLPAGGMLFFGALAQGQSVAAAARAAMAGTAQFDLAANRAMLDKSNVVVGFREVP
jgi:hypothetical protein